MPAPAPKPKIHIDAISVHKSIREDEEAITFMFAVHKLGRCKAIRTHNVIKALRIRIDLGGGAFDINDLILNGLVEINHGVDHKGDHSVALTDSGRDLLRQLLESKNERILLIHREVHFVLAGNPIEIRTETHEGSAITLMYPN